MANGHAGPGRTGPHQGDTCLEWAVDIHQMQMRYEPTADRLLWQVRTFGGDVYAVWLTRRMLRLLWPPFQHLVTQGDLRQALPHATPAAVMPEARAMLAEQVRARALPDADFKAPFNPQAVARPLGDEPMLPQAADLGPGQDGRGLMIRLREAQGRALELRLTADLATALARLFDQALAAADWGLGPATPAPAEPDPDAAPAQRVLN